MSRSFSQVALALFLVGSSALVLGRVGAQTGGGTRFGNVDAVVMKPAKITAGEKAYLEVSIGINPGFHINSNKPKDEMSIPTTITVSVPKGSGVTVGKPEFPEPTMIPVGYSPKPISGYSESIVVRVPLETKATTKPGTIKITGTLRAQGCNATSCLPPRSFPIDTTLTVNGAKK